MNIRSILNKIEFIKNKVFHGVLSDVLFVAMLTGALLLLVRMCNTTVQDITSDIPIVGPIINQIEHHIPSIIGGTHQSSNNIEVVDLTDGRKKTFKKDIHIDVGAVSSIRTSGVSARDVIPRPNLGVSFFSYGKSKKETDYRFLRLGVGGLPNRGVDLTLSPVMLNLGSLTKSTVLSNTYAHAFGGINLPSGGPIVGVGLSVSF